MNQEILARATKWTQELVRKNNAQLPEWGSYQKSLREFLHAAPSGYFKVPVEYEYAYLRTKGLSDADARARMGLESENTANKKRSGGFFSNLF
jgi:hypothetical protein